MSSLDYYRRRNRITWLKNTFVPAVVMVFVAIAMAALWDEQIGEFIAGWFR